MINIVIPMAGRGSRFAVAGFAQPKPLIPVHGKPMIQVVIENLRPACAHRFIFICQADHVAAYDLRPALGDWAPGCEIIELDGVTQGAACTVLAAERLIADDTPLMIANSDQYLDVAIDDYLAFCGRRELDGCIMTMTAHDPKWSFAAIDQQGRVTRVAEKEPISDHATTGVYNFSRGRLFAEGAKKMIAADRRVNGEFYVAPVYNELVADGAHIGIFDIGTDLEGMYGLGTPDDLARFLELPLSRAAVAGR